MPTRVDDSSAAFALPTSVRHRLDVPAVGVLRQRLVVPTRVGDSSAAFAPPASVRPRQNILEIGLAPLRRAQALGPEGPNESATSAAAASAAVTTVARWPSRQLLVGSALPMHSSPPAASSIRQHGVVFSSGGLSSCDDGGPLAPSTAAGQLCSADALVSTCCQLSSPARRCLQQRRLQQR